MAMTAGTSSETVRARVIGRALEAANERATSRVDRFLDAAFGLVAERSPCTDFSVHEVVERSGQSLRTFYGSYRSRNELLLGMLEASVQSTLERLACATATQTDAVERLRILVVELHRCCRKPQRAGDRPLPAALVLHLLSTDPGATGRILEPLVDLLADNCREAIGTARPKSTPQPRSLAATIVNIVLLDELSGVIAPLEGSLDDAADEVWALISGGLRPTARRGRRRRG